MLEKLDEPRSGIGGDREFGDDRLDRKGFGIALIRVAAGHDRSAGQQPIHAERLAIEIHTLGQAERPVELTVECRIPALDIDSERLEQPVHGMAE